MFKFLRRSKEENVIWYRPCPNCDAVNWQARGRGEIIERRNNLYHRQYHHCLNCGVRMRLIRHIESKVWSQTIEQAVFTR